MSKYDSFDFSLIQDLYEEGKPDAYYDFFQSNNPVKIPTYEIGRSVFRTGTDQKIAGFEVKEFSGFDDILNLVHEDDLGFLWMFSHEFMKHVKRFGMALSTFKASSNVIFRMRGKHNKIHYVRKKSIINGVRQYVPTHSVSYVEDVSWMKPINRSWSYEGPGHEGFDFSPPVEKEIKSKLTIREIELLKHLSEGKNSIEIAEDLFISKYTVDTHRKNLKRKFSVNNTVALVDLARQYHLI